MLRRSKRVQARKVRILAVDHNPLLREGLSLLIQLQPEMELIASVSSFEEAVQAFQSDRPDVALLDLDLPCSKAIATLREILKLAPAACVIGLSTHEGDTCRTQALKAGARSCLTKDRLTQDLIPLIRDCSRHG